MDPGHDAPSTSVVASQQQQQQPGVTVAPNISILSSGGNSLGTALGAAPPMLSVATSGLSGTVGRNELPSCAAVAAAGTAGNTNSVDNRGATATNVPQQTTAAALLDPFRQAFFGGTNLSALNAATGSTIGTAADFGNLFFPSAQPNAVAAAAYPLFAQIFQQQQAQQVSIWWLKH